MTSEWAALGVAAAVAALVLLVPPRWAGGLERYGMVVGRAAGGDDRSGGSSGSSGSGGGGVPQRPRRPFTTVVGRWRSSGRGTGDRELVALLDVLVPALRAGLPVALALGEAGGPFDAPGWVRELTLHLRAEAATGRPLAGVWAVHAAASGSSEGAFVARAWALSETLGAPLAESVAEAASAVRARISRAQRLEVVVAGPRATARVLTLLPLAGPLAATAMGVSPRALYSGFGAVGLAAGLALLLVGRAWCARLLRGVARSVPAAELR